MLSSKIRETLGRLAVIRYDNISSLIKDVFNEKLIKVYIVPNKHYILLSRIEMFYFFEKSGKN